MSMVETLFQAEGITMIVIDLFSLKRSVHL